MSNDIIIVEQIPVIKQRLQTVKEDIIERVEGVITLECTPDTVKTVKQARADLNKEFAEWEEKRKQVKAAVMNPYEQFESIYKDCISDVFKEADLNLKCKINSVENDLKQEKETAVKAYFDEYCKSKNIDFVRFEQAGLNITLSATEKKLKEQAAEFIDNISNSLTLIDTQEHKEEILVEFKKCLNAAEAIMTVKQRHIAIETEKAAAEKRQELQDKDTAIETAVNEALPQEQEEITYKPVEDEKELTVSFKVTATKSRLKALKEYLINGGYKYE